MPADKTAIVIIDRHEPEGDTAGRLLDIAKDKGYSPSVVEAVRGEHDAGLSFRVPADVAEVFDGERAALWPDDSAKRRETGQLLVDGTIAPASAPTDQNVKIENEAEKPAEQPAPRRTKKTEE